MNLRFTKQLTFYSLLPIFIFGCTTLTVPPGESGTVRIIEGGLVESMVFGGTTLNIQITAEDNPDYDYIIQHVLTIGRFSPAIGSGFTNRSNIYYESEINSYGEDTFMVGNEKYRVYWREIDVIPSYRNPASVFSITIEKNHL